MSTIAYTLARLSRQAPIQVAQEHRCARSPARFAVRPPAISRLPAAVSLAGTREGAHASGDRQRPASGVPGGWRRAGQARAQASQQGRPAVVAGEWTALGAAGGLCELPQLRQRPWQRRCRCCSAKTCYSGAPWFAAHSPPLPPRPLIADRVKCRERSVDPLPRPASNGQGFFYALAPLAPRKEMHTCLPC